MRTPLPRGTRHHGAMALFEMVFSPKPAAVGCQVQEDAWRATPGQRALQTSFIPRSNLPVIRHHASCSAPSMLSSSEETSSSSASGFQTMVKAVGAGATCWDADCDVHIVLCLCPHVVAGKRQVIRHLMPPHDTSTLVNAAELPFTTSLLPVQCCSAWELVLK